METQAQDPKADIDQLNAFLKDELSAVETYQQCLDKIDRPEITSELSHLQSSHQKRVSLLRDRVQELGGTPKSDSGVWGSFSKLVEGGATMFGEKSAISALEQGEDRGEKDYRDRVNKLSPANQEFIKTSIAPEHEQTHSRLERLKSVVH